MRASRIVLAIVGLASTAAGCRFAPDLSAYPKCVDGTCPAGMACLASEGICVECAEGEPACAGLDAGATPDTGPLHFEGETLGKAKVGSMYLQILHAAGGAPPYTFSIASGGLPAGLALTAWGTLSGMPTEAGSAAFVVQVTDSTSQVAAKGFVLPVDPATGDALKIDTETLEEGQVATAYSMDLLASDGTAPYQWGVASGALPSGLALNGKTGSLYGVPAEPGETTLELRVSDSSTPVQTAQRSFALRVNPAQGQALAIQTTAVPDGVAGTYYLAQLEVSGGTPQYTWSLAAGSSLPTGLSLSSAGAISGTPGSAGTVSFTAQVVDSSTPAQTSSRTLSLSVSIAATGDAGTVPPLSITTASLPEGTVQVAYSASLAASGGTAPVSFTLTSGSSLPTGLLLSTTGAVTGTPQAAGTFSVGITAKDSSSPVQTASRGYALTIGTGTSVTPLSVATSTLPSGTVGMAYAQTLSATGGTVPYGWSLTSGALPPGLSLAASGAISGTATMAGGFSFTAKVADASTPQQQASRSFSLNVIAAVLNLETASLPNATQNVAYNAQVNASGGTQPYLFSLKTGALPKGLTLCESGACAGRIAGTPQTRGKSQFEVEVTDSSVPVQNAIKQYAIDVL